MTSRKGDLYTIPNYVLFSTLRSKRKQDLVTIFVTSHKTTLFRIGPNYTDTLVRLQWHVIHCTIYDTVSDMYVRTFLDITTSVGHVCS